MLVIPTTLVTRAEDHKLKFTRLSSRISKMQTKKAEQVNKVNNSILIIQIGQLKHSDYMTNLRHNTMM